MLAGVKLHQLSLLLALHEAAVGSSGGLDDLLYSSQSSHGAEILPGGALHIGVLLRHEENEGTRIHRGLYCLD